MTKHTPGPWKLQKALRPVDGEYDYGIGAKVSGRGQCIAEAFGRCSDRDLLPAEANARLIAAAPEMLEALVNCSSLLGAFIGPDDAVGQAALKEAAAILKAQGQD